MSTPKRSSIQIIADTVAALVFTVLIESVVDNMDGTFTLTVCDVFHSQIGYTVTIGDNDYRIVDMEAPTMLKVSGTEAITVDSFQLYPPFFAYGTPISNENDLSQENRADAKFPMVWMLIPFYDHFYTDPEMIYDREIKCKIYFLGQSDSTLKVTAQQYTDTVTPMHSLMETFIAKVRQLVGIYDSTDLEIDTLDYPKFGVFITEKGNLKRKFADDLAGVELSITLPVFRSPYCDNCP